MINRIRWALLMLAIHRYRRGLIFSHREAFDLALRPHAPFSGDVITYPDAIYRVTREDFERAKGATWVGEERF